MILKVGMLVKTVPLIFKSFNIHLGTAEMLVPSEGGPPKRILLPLSMAEFELGMYGSNSWVHPVDLPTSHPNFVTWINPVQHKVRHNRSGEGCFLQLGKEFHSFGEFTLTLLSNGEKVNKQSIAYNPSTAQKKLNELIGAEMTFKGRILSIIIDGYAEESVYLNQITQKKKSVEIVFTSLQWQSIGMVDVNYLNLQKETPTKEKRRKWKKRAK